MVSELSSTRSAYGALDAAILDVLQKTPNGLTCREVKAALDQGAKTPTKIGSVQAWLIRAEKKKIVTLQGRGTRTDPRRITLANPQGRMSTTSTPTSATPMPKPKPRRARQTPIQTGSRVFWNEEETNRLVDGFIEEWRKNPLASNETFARVMHRLLPHNRWRKLNNIPNAIRAKILQKQVGILTPQPPQLKVIEVPIEVPLSRCLEQASFKDLLGEIGSRFDTALNGLSHFTRPQVPSVSVSVPIPSVPSTSSAPIIQSTPAYPRIWLIGPLEGQFKELRERLRNHPLKFLGCADKDKSPSAVGIPQSADYVLIDTRFANHAWTNHAHRIVGREKTILLSGIRSIEDWLRDLAVKTQKSIR